MESLPAPLTLFICKALPDLKSLDALTQASPMFAEVFEYHGVEIFEHLMFETLHEQLIRLIRAHVILHANPELVKNISDPVVALEALYDAASTRLASKTTTRALSNILRHVHDLYDFTTEILEAKLDYLRTLHFERLEDPDQYMACTWNSAHYPMAGLLALPYTVEPLSPPSWIEEQRVMRALLRITLFSDLAGLTTPRSLDRLSRVSPTDSFEIICQWAPYTILSALRGNLRSGDLFNQYFEQDEFDEVADSLVKLFSFSDEFKGFAFPWMPFHHTDESVTSVSSKVSGCNTQLSTTTLSPRRWNAPGSPPSSLHVTPPNPFQPVPDDGCNRDPWYMKEPTELSRSISAHIQRSRGPLYGAEWALFRSLGFGLWDSYRTVMELELSRASGALRKPPLDLISHMYIIGVDEFLAPVDQVFRWKRLYEKEVLKLQKKEMKPERPS